VRLIQALHKRYYPTDLWRYGRLEIISVLFGAAVLGLAIVSMMTLFLGSIGDLLFIKDAEILIDFGYSTGFSQMITKINRLSLYEHLAFLGYMGVLCMLLSLYSSQGKYNLL
jgi:hypothetical protein